MSRWLPERSIEAVRAALIDVCPEIARLPIVLSDEWEDVGNPVWARSSAFVDGEWVVKFAWSAPAAERLEREIQLLRALVDVEDGPPVARVHACGSDPVLLVCPFVPGSPVTRDAIDRYSPAQKQRLAVSLARLLAQFHDPMTHNAVLQAGIKLPGHDPQATTNDLRARLCPMLDPARRQLVAQWCDWTDEILAAPGTAALVHGDFHGFNVIIDDNESVCVALDVETSSYGDFHYDFRYLPAQEATVELFVRCADEYERLTTRPVELPRVMAWHVRTVLGDALWRTEAAVGLPGGGTKEAWVDELDERFTELGLARSGRYSE